MKKIKINVASHKSDVKNTEKKAGYKHMNCIIFSEVVILLAVYGTVTI